MTPPADEPLDERQPTTTCPACGSPRAADSPACLRCGHSFVPTIAHRPGLLLAGRYELRRVLGKGAMGMVYEAHDRLLNERVAIKVLRTDVSEAGVVGDRFITEIKLARAVSHRNVCRIHEYGEDRGLRYISMAYVDGVDVRAVLRQRGPLPAEEGYDIAIALAEGLQAIHDEGIVHRDLKTPNIMIDARGGVKLMDFGIAKHTESQAGMTGTGNIVGTPEYMSPEQVRGLKVDCRSDLYSLGIVIYEIFTGRTPFRGDTPVATILHHLQTPPPLEGPEAARIPAPLLPVLRRLLAKQPEERYASAEALAAALEEARRKVGAPKLDAAPRASDSVATTLMRPPRPARSDASHTRGPARHGPSAARARPSRVPLVASAVLLVAIVLIGAVLWWGGGTRAPQSASDAQPPESAPAASLPPAAPGPAPPTVATIPAPPTKGVPDAADVVARPLQVDPRAIGSAEASLAAARRALAQGEYASAAEHARAGLRQEPASREARHVLSLAEGGMQAEPSFREAEAALTRGDLEAAHRHAEAGRAAAPWHGRGGALLARIREAYELHSRRAEARVAKLLADAESALEVQKYDTAIGFYDEVLKIDRQNQIARMGRATSINARVTAQAAAGPVRAATGRALSAGTTIATSAESKGDPAFDAGFHADPSLQVKKDTGAPALPGRIQFDVQPPRVVPGERYTLKITFTNTGPAPIQIKDLVVTTTVNGRKSTGPVPPLVKVAAPGQTAVLLSASDFWGEGVRTWSMEVVVHSTRGETYKNTINAE